MCGRINLRVSSAELQGFFDLFRSPEIVPRHNICPTQAIVAVRQNEAGQRCGEMLHWGLVPSWAKSPQESYRLINARSEGLPDKPAFRAAFKRRRCLIPVSGFYEWQLVGPRRKVPWEIRSANGDPLALAGLWESWRPESGPVLESCTIITTQANAAMRDLHDRMPVILDRSSWADWLDPHLDDNAQLQQLLVSCPPAWLNLEPVDPSVDLSTRRAGAPRNQQRRLW